jgi:hypothetical protein
MYANKRISRSVNYVDAWDMPLRNCRTIVMQQRCRSDASLHAKPRQNHWYIISSKKYYFFCLTCAYSLWEKTAPKKTLTRTDTQKKNSTKICGPYWVRSYWRKDSLSKKFIEISKVILILNDFRIRNFYFDSKLVLKVFFFYHSQYINNRSLAIQWRTPCRCYATWRTNLTNGLQLCKAL